jgi:signal transduction histidine kinase
MQAIVNGLLAIARCEAGTQPVSRETVDLAELVREVWKLSETVASQRELTVRLEVERCGFATTDRAMVASSSGTSYPTLWSTPRAALPFALLRLKVGARLKCWLRTRPTI